MNEPLSIYEETIRNNSNPPQRWVAYFDLLGFSDFVKNEEEYRRVSMTYNNILIKAINMTNTKYSNGILDTIYFSDTFIFYTKDDSSQSFGPIHVASEFFLRNTIREKLPARGAITNGGFYVNKAHGIYHGPALIEAHQYGENQDWIGFVLTPASAERFEQGDLPVDNADYIRHKVPRGESSVGLRLSEYLYAHIIGESNKISSGGTWENRPLNELCAIHQELKEKEVDVKILRKYTNTINFIKNNEIKLPPPAPPFSDSTEG